MSECAKRLIESNPYLGARICVIHGKVNMQRVDLCLLSQFHKRAHYGFQAALDFWSLSYSS
jgi:hypothetical protein